MLSTLAAMYCQFAWPHRGGPCPACGAEVTPPPLSGARPWEHPVRCAACGWSGCFLHLTDHGAGPPRLPRDAGNAAAADGDRPPLPPDSRIRHTPGPPETWVLPRGGRAFLLWLGLLWLSVSTVVGVSVFVTTGRDSGDWVWPRLAAALFMGIGAVLVWYGLSLKYCTTLLTLDAETLTMERRSRIPGLSRLRTLRRAAITDIELREFYTVNYQPVYGLIIRSRDGKKLRFGSNLPDADKAWLEQDLRRALRLTHSAAGAPGADAESGRAPTAALEVETRADSVTLRHWRARSSLVGAGAFVFFLGLAITTAAWLGLPGDATGWIFRMVFTTATLVIMGIGLTLFRAGLRRSRVLTILHADAAGLTLEVQRRGVSDGPPQHWRRAELRHIQYCVAGTYNGRPLALGEIVTDHRVHLFCIGARLEDVETMGTALRRVLALPGTTAPPDSIPPA